MHLFHISDNYSFFSSIWHGLILLVCVCDQAKNAAVCEKVEILNCAIVSMMTHMSVD